MKISHNPNHYAHTTSHLKVDFQCFLWGYANMIDASHLPCRVLGYYLPSVENGGLSRLSLEVS
jgi:hypothetical protein